MWVDQDNLSVTLTAYMESVLRNKLMETEEGILHHKEGVDLILVNIELPGIEKCELCRKKKNENFLKFFQISEMVFRIINRGDKWLETAEMLMLFESKISQLQGV